MKISLFIAGLLMLAAQTVAAAPVDSGAVNLCSYEVETMVNALVTAESENLANAGIDTKSVKPQITYQTSPAEMGVTVDFTVSLGSVQSFASGTATANADTCIFGSIQRTRGDD